MQDLVIGVVQAPYGLQGELKLRSLSGEIGHFLNLVGKSVRLRKEGAERMTIVASVREVIPHFLVKFQGFDSPEAARALTGSEIIVDRSLAAPLRDGEYYIADLIGAAVSVSGQTVGFVESVWENGAHDMLEVRLSDGRLVQVPLREPFIGAVDTALRTIEVLTDWVLT